MAKDFKISKTEGKCHKCEQPIPPGEEIIALVRTAEDELAREDYHLACWEELAEQNPSQATDVLGVWRTHVPKKEEKKKLLIDDGLLVNFFERLEGHDDPSRKSFRYVLALILMRKRLLTYKGMDKKDGNDIWKMRLRGSEQIHEVIDPHLDEDKIAEVSASLGEIMAGDFE
ncbi:MAG: hypothetical protein K8S55_01460 [Phycisphaerae bacterium]|nr:hypothetical protein [Phycisphaerae bacterium]